MFSDQTFCGQKFCKANSTQPQLKLLSLALLSSSCFTCSYVLETMLIPPSPPYICAGTGVDVNHIQQP